MKRLKIIFLTLLSVIPAFSAESSEESPLTITLTGASFAVKENGWFELGCSQLGAICINKAVSAQAIMNTANDMYGEKFFTAEQMEKTDIFVIDHVHNKNVSDEQWLKEDYHDYTMPTTNYAIAYDYVIKRYIDECRKLKDNPASKYYGSENGKPAVIVLCTHWHDSRTTYNKAIRQLAEKWNLPLIEFDRLIGFSKDDLIDGKQPSLLYASDTETIDKVVYGWHPRRGQGEYIQQKMAQIFVKEIAEVIGRTIDFKATLTHKDFAVMEGDSAYCRLIAEGGLYPYTFSYDINGSTQPTVEFSTNPLFIKIPESAIGKPINAIALTDGEGTAATIEGCVCVNRATRKILLVFDSYVQESAQTKTYADEPILQLKSGQGWSREIYLTFNTDEVKDDDKNIVLRLFLDSTDKNCGETLALEGNTRTYDKTLSWSNKNRYSFEPIGTTTLNQAEIGSYLSWDVTSWIQEKKAAGATKVTFRIGVKTEGASLSAFHASESTEHPELCPNLIVVEGEKSSVETLSPKNTPAIYPSLFSDYLHIPHTDDVTIFAIDGNIVYSGNDTTIDTSHWPSGLYIAKIKTSVTKLIKR